MSKIAFLYPGQGAQKAGMGADFYENSPIAREVFEQAGEALHLDMKKLCFEENPNLHLTEYTQAALATMELAQTRILMEAGIKPDLTAGLSLGEYSAIAAAGAMEALDAIGLVRKRGILMQNTVPAGVGAMCAVLSLEEAVIEQVLAEFTDVTVANYNCPGQTVITGKKEAVEAAAEKLKKAGARRVLPLKVSGPFHSPLLKPAGEVLLKELQKIDFKPLQCPYVTNVTAEMVTDSRQIVPLLKQQISAPVRWRQSMETMLSLGIDTFIEIGPGKTLTGFLKKMNRETKVYNIATWEDFKEYLC